MIIISLSIWNGQEYPNIFKCINITMLTFIILPVEMVSFVIYTLNISIINTLTISLFYFMLF
jgi:hypothetical protein